MQKILVVDDDRDMRLLLTRFLQKHGYDVSEAIHVKNALELIETSVPDLILSDFKLGESTGSELLLQLQLKHPLIPVIIITGYADIRIAVEVMKLGAYDYVTKPLLPDEILRTIVSALETPKKQNKSVEQLTVSGSGTKSQYLFGGSMHFTSLLEQINRVAPTNYSVIIYGETGSGKEAVAQEIHRRSARSNKTFIAIDCGALSKELAGSELFGHEKGSFTGALAQKIGNFELANEGTIFLDEVANLPYDVQVSLLRVISERKMRRVGGTRDIPLDVRIIIASNESLWDNERKNKLKFREDLFHRFNEFSITVPPLRERKEDITLFANHFLQQTNADLGKQVKGFSPEVKNIFNNYVWYGNLRELKNVVKRAALLTDGEWIEAESLPFEITHFNKLQFEQSSVPDPRSASVPAPAVNPPVAQQSLKDAGIGGDYELILATLKKVNFNKSKAAKLLQIDRKTLYNKLEQYQLLK